MGDLSKNFNRHEFACGCGCGMNEPDPLLVGTLQRLRDRVGEPVRITSGCRCERYNKAEGGAARSQHLLGKAADIYVDGMDQDQLMAIIIKLHLDEELYVGYAYTIGDSDRAVHVDVRVPESLTVRGWRHGAGTDH